MSTRGQYRFDFGATPTRDTSATVTRTLVIELEPAPAPVMLPSGAALLDVVLVNTELAMFAAREAKATAPAPPKKRKKIWIVCGACGDPGCELSRWEEVDAED